MSDWKVIFRDAVSGVAGVTVYDKGRADILGRYVVAKVMKFDRAWKPVYRHTQSYFVQRPAAVRRAKKFLQERAAKVGREYVSGDGAKTLGFAPLCGCGAEGCNLCAAQADARKGGAS